MLLLETRSSSIDQLPAIIARRRLCAWVCNTFKEPGIVNKSQTGMLRHVRILPALISFEHAGYIIAQPCASNAEPTQPAMSTHAPGRQTLPRHAHQQVFGVPIALQPAVWHPALSMFHAAAAPNGPPSAGCPPASEIPATTAETGLQHRQPPNSVPHASDVQQSMAGPSEGHWAWAAPANKVTVGRNGSSGTGRSICLPHEQSSAPRLLPTGKALVPGFAPSTS